MTRLFRRIGPERAVTLTCGRLVRAALGPASNRSRAAWQNDFDPGCAKTVNTFIGDLRLWR
jgi:hypothetical protein